MIITLGFTESDRDADYSSFSDGYVRHEAPWNRVEVKDLRRWTVAAVWRSWGQSDLGNAGEGGKQP